MPNLVFVFGTLKEGFPNFHINEGIRLAGDFVTAHRYPLYLMGERHSPWLVNQPGEGHQVTGQVFAVGRQTLEHMDKLERTSESDGYRRTLIQVVSVDTPSKPAMPVFAYLKPIAQFDASNAVAGPLPAYTLEHAMLYKSRKE